jgi:hypothetical protein
VSPDALLGTLLPTDHAELRADLADSRALLVSAGAPAGQPRGLDAAAAAAA